MLHVPFLAVLAILLPDPVWAHGETHDHGHHGHEDHPHDHEHGADDHHHAHDHDHGAPHADGTRQADAHVHGLATLDIAQDGPILTIELHGAMYNFMGFERPPQSDAEQAALRRAHAVLTDPDRVVALPEAAGCMPQAVASSTEQAVAAAAPESGVFLDLSARYTLRCEDSAALDRVTVMLFSHFERLETVEAAFIGADHQTGARLTAADPDMALR